MWKPGGPRRGRPWSDVPAEVVRGLYAEGYGLAQLARAFGVSVSTIQRRLGRKY